MLSLYLMAQPTVLLGESISVWTGAASKVQASQGTAHLREKVACDVLIAQGRIC